VWRRGPRWGIRGPSIRGEAASSIGSGARRWLVRALCRVFPSEDPAWSPEPLPLARLGRGAREVVPRAPALCRWAPDTSGYALAGLVVIDGSSM
jgi:hypothetical protein